MRSSNKSRNRNNNKNNNRRSNNNNNNMGNIVNRVFDSSGPEGKVRGTPQQIVDKYQSLSSDALLSGDRIAAENFLQHSEHYSRMLGVATREMNERREQQEAQQRKVQQQNQADAEKQAKLAEQSVKSQPAPVPSSDSEQPDISSDSELFPGQDNNSSLVVDTPEASSPQQPAPKKRTPRPRKPRPTPVDAAPASDVTETPSPIEATPVAE
jgi:hypothetical protein